MTRPRVVSSSQFTRLNVEATYLMPPRLLFGSDAYNAHVQNMAVGVYVADCLSEFVTRGVDSARSPVGRWVRRAAGRVAPAIDRHLARRRVEGIPASMVRSRWAWEIPRLMANRAGWLRIEDRLWERGEHALDRHCASLVNRQEVGGFFGVEHGSLSSLRTARALGKPGFLAFVSPHHATRQRLVDAEYDRDPSLGSPAARDLVALGAVRDRRVDSEIEVARWFVSNSSFTTRSLVSAGVDATRVLTVPLGCPPACTDSELPSAPPTTMRFLYAGPLSVRKGVHYLLRAWRQARPPGAELHFFGKPLLPDAAVRRLVGDALSLGIVFHGPVAPDALNAAYLSSSVLVFPTLCDGFGQVASEALAHGVPVLTTGNAGAADLIVHGRNGWIVAAADDAALGAQLEWCASHPQDVFAMRRPALASARAWTWLDFRRRFHDLMATALHEARGA